MNNNVAKRRTRFFEPDIVAWPELDPVLLLIAVMLPLVGLVAVTSARMPQGAENPTLFGAETLRHLCITAVGFGLCIVAAQIDYRRYGSKSWVLYAISILFLVALLIPGVAEGDGPRRWLNTPLISFQPSELTKLSLLLLLSYGAGKSSSSIGSLKTFGFGLALLLIPTLLIVAQPDLGTSLIVLTIGGTIGLVSGTKWRHLIAVPTLAVIAGLVSVALNPYQWTRVRSFLDPSLDPLGGAYQAKQTLLALGSGGIAGKGLGMGTMKYHYLPAAPTDSILAVIGEEGGLLATSLIVVTFTALLARGLWIAAHAPDTFGQCLAAGISFQITMQAFVNILVVSGLIPVTGIPLPFISSGGSSLIISLIMMGILLNIARAGRMSRKL
tara:strand:+ start:1232 stop:2383 length:1152 start_codon:yes stop_codon:yes gene_type:complete